MGQNDSEADEKDHAQNRAAERMTPKQEMRQQSAQQQNSKGDDQWVAHGGSRCFRKPDHLAASPVILCTRLILNRARWGRQPASCEDSAANGRRLREASALGVSGSLPHQVLFRDGYRNPDILNLSDGCLE